MNYFKLMIKTISICVIVFLTSCSGKHEISHEKYTSMNISEKIDYLYQIFPDTNTVSRMTLALPENIQNIQSGKVRPSEKFSQRVDEICLYYIQNDFNNPKTLREYDPEFGWYDKVWDIDYLYGWYWFWGILALAILFTIICKNSAPLIIVSVFYFLCGLLSLIFFMLADPIEKEPYPSYIIINTTQNKNSHLNSTKIRTIEPQTSSNTYVKAING